MTETNIYSAITDAGWTLGQCEVHAPNVPVVYSARLQRDNSTFVGTGVSQGDALLDALKHVNITAQSMMSLTDAIKMIVDLMEAANE